METGKALINLRIRQAQARALAQGRSISRDEALDEVARAANFRACMAARLVAHRSFMRLLPKAGAETQAQALRLGVELSPREARDVVFQEALAELEADRRSHHG